MLGKTSFSGDFYEYFVKGKSFLRFRRAEPDFLFQLKTGGIFYIIKLHSTSPRISLRSSVLKIITLTQSWSNDDEKICPFTEQDKKRTNGSSNNKSSSEKNKKKSVS